jgi:hypothetical protein
MNKGLPITCLNYLAQSHEATKKFKTEASFLNFVALWLCAISFVGTCFAQEGKLQGWPTVGIEAGISARFPRDDLAAVGAKEHAELLLRIVSVKPAGADYLYDLRYIGLLPGNYNLVDYLVLPEGMQTNSLPAVMVKVNPLLPPGHQGELVSQQLRSHTLPGGYTLFFAGVWVVWALLLIPLILAFREKKQVSASVEVYQPTLADILRPLLERALEGKLDVSGKEHLERLMVGYWQKELNLDEANAYQILLKIKQHPEGRELIENLERWLHQPPERAKIDMESILRPYMTLLGTCSKQQEADK